MTVACRGQCKGDRAAWESPAVVYQKRLACPCCGIFLTRAPATVEYGRAPNLNRELADNTILFEDNVCHYNVRAVPEVVPK